MLSQLEDSLGNLYFGLLSFWAIILILGFSSTGVDDNSYIETFSGTIPLRHYFIEGTTVLMKDLYTLLGEIKVIWFTLLFSAYYGYKET